MNKILKYQEYDIELSKLQKYVDTMPAKVNMERMANFVKEAQSRTFRLEESARTLNAEYKNLTDKLNEMVSAVKKITSAKDAKLITEPEYKKIYQQVNSLSSEAFMLDRNFNKMIESARKTLADFENTKQNVLKARTKHKESKDNYEQEMGKYTPKINSLKQKMNALASEIPSDVIEKYNAIKNDGVFPVFAPIVDNKCGACKTEIPSVKLNNLKPNGIIVCEQCRRRLFNEK